MICVECNSTTTHIRESGSERWYNYKDGKVCHRCYYKLIASPRYYKNHIQQMRMKSRIWYESHPEEAKSQNRKTNAIHHLRRLRYKDKQILLKENPRTGECSICHRKVGQGIKQTQMHHLEYDDSDPLAHTIELCVRCHKEQHYAGML